MAVLDVTAQEAALAAAMATELSTALLNGTGTGVAIAAPYPLTSIPQVILDLAKITMMVQLRSSQTQLGLALRSYTVAGLPSAVTAGAGRMIYVSNEAGGAVPAFSDGTNWRRVTDRVIVS